MRRIAVFALVLSVLALSHYALSSGRDGAGYTFCSYAFGKKYTSEFTYEQLAKSPSWNTDRADSPPFPVGKAVRLANVQKVRLVKDLKRYRWYLESVGLNHLGWLAEDSDLSEKWWWCVTYEAHQREGGSTGPPEQLLVIVLMDGTVIVPKVTVEDKNVTQP